MDVFPSFPLWQLLVWCSCFFLISWVLHLGLRNASLADLGFCLAFGILVLTCGIFSSADLFRRLLIVSMGLGYAARLGHHLWTDRVWNKSEDARYQMIRTRLGCWETLGIFCYFQLQAPACLFFAGLLCWVMNHPVAGLRWWDVLGMITFLVAVVGEHLADRQLKIFRQNPQNKGKTLQSGLWRYSRHPNYFFESLHWWTYVPMAVGLPWFGLTVIWPLLMMSSLFWITGIPWAEAQALTSRGDSYRRYQQSTSMFIPWFPRTSTIQSEA